MPRKIRALERNTKTLIQVDHNKASPRLLSWRSVAGSMIDGMKALCAVAIKPPRLCAQTFERADAFLSADGPLGQGSMPIIWYEAEQNPAASEGEERSRGRHLVEPSNASVETCSFSCNASNGVLVMDPHCQKCCRSLKVSPWSERKWEHIFVLQLVARQPIRRSQTTGTGSGRSERL